MVVRCAPTRLQNKTIQLISQTPDYDYASCPLQHADKDPVIHLHYSDWPNKTRPTRAKLLSSQTAGIASPSFSLLPPSPGWQLPQPLLLTVCHICKVPHILYWSQAFLYHFWDSSEIREDKKRNHFKRIKSSNHQLSLQEHFSKGLC